MRQSWTTLLQSLRKFKYSFLQRSRQNPGLSYRTRFQTLPVDQTKNLISLIRTHVSFSPGCRVLLNWILSHVGSYWIQVILKPMSILYLNSERWRDATYGGVVDLLIIKGTPTYVGENQINAAFYLLTCFIILSVFTERTVYRVFLVFFLEITHTWFIISVTGRRFRRQVFPIDRDDWCKGYAVWDR